MGHLDDSKVRASRFYAVRINADKTEPPAGSSFVYMSIPRAGSKGQDSRPDGAEFAADARLTMSWTTFLYRETVWVEIERVDGRAIHHPDDVVIRPTTLDFKKVLASNGNIRIQVPHHPAGYRFSVEFKDDLVTSYNDMSGYAGKLTLDPSGKAIHTEPRNALMIFAEPFPSGHAASPTETAGTTYYPEPGMVTNLHAINADTIHFRPGIYWMPRDYHGHLHNRVNHVHIEGGAYVKGALEFGGMQDSIRVSGHGVLSGELYVYEADKRQTNGHRPYDRRDEQSSDCHGTCVRMLQFYSATRPQRITVEGITIANPPYHAIAVFGDAGSVITDFAHYKQVGGWYWQTDGVELFPGGTLVNSFLHSNDDVIKLYHSDVSVQNVVVWKAENGPVFQWGWIPRTIRNVRVRDVDIIHNRMFWRDAKHNAGIFNSALHWTNQQGNSADPTAWIEDFYFENIRSEGMNLAAMRFFMLSNWRNVVIRHLWIEAWNGLEPHEQKSQFVSIGSAGGIKTRMDPDPGLVLVDYRVGDEVITKHSGNWASHQSGRLDFDAELWNAWDARE